MKEINLRPTALAIMENALASNTRHATEELPPDVQALIRLSGLKVVKSGQFTWFIFDQTVDSVARKYSLAMINGYDWFVAGTNIPYTEWQRALTAALEWQRVLTAAPEVATSPEHGL